MDELLRSSVGDAPSLPLLIELFAVVVRFVAVDGWPWGEIGGDPALVKYSLWAAWWNCCCFDAACIALECWAADIFASNDWNDALGEYNDPTPGGKICDGGVLNIKETKQKKQFQIKFNVNEVTKRSNIARIWRWNGYKQHTPKKRSVKGQKEMNISKSSNGYELLRSIKHDAETIIKNKKKVNEKRTQDTNYWRIKRKLRFLRNIDEKATTTTWKSELWISCWDRCKIVYRSITCEIDVSMLVVEPMRRASVDIGKRLNRSYRMVFAN